MAWYTYMCPWLHVWVQCFLFLPLQRDADVRCSFTWHILHQWTPLCMYESAILVKLRNRAVYNHRGHLYWERDAVPRSSLWALLERSERAPWPRLHFSLFLVRSHRQIRWCRCRKPT